MLVSRLKDDLFDMVLTGSVANDRRLPSRLKKTEDNKTEIEKPKVPALGSVSTAPAPTKKLGVYVGKFPWVRNSRSHISVSDGFVD